jgi:hypothetical protein
MDLSENVFLFLSITPFLFYFIILQKMKPSSTGEKMYVDYLFYSNYTLSWILFYLKYLFLALFIFFKTGNVDIVMGLLFGLDLMKYKMLKISANLSYEDYLESRISIITNQVSDHSESNKMKKELINELINKSGFFSIYFNEFIFMVVLSSTIALTIN